VAQKKPQPKPKQKSESLPVARATIEKSLTALANRVSGSAPSRRGSILLHFTDSGEDYCVEGSGRQARVTSAAGAAPVLVRIAGPSSVLKAIMAGEKEASKAFVAGGLQVSGDLVYLESLLKELGLLKCE
jgi:putative sterol carrier protein